MKKQRKIGGLSSTATFISQFKLKSNQIQKEERHKKFTTTFSHFKQHFLQQESKNRENKQFSRQKKPFVEQLKFLVNNKEDDFKAPRSLSKRSNSKSHMEDDRRKLQKLNNQIFEQFYQEIKLDKQKKKSTAYMWDMVRQRKFKQKAMQNAVKQKIEKNALEKFKDAISKENEQVQNKINEKNAEALYMLLKTGRSRNLKNIDDNMEDREDQQKRYKHMPAQINVKREKLERNSGKLDQFNQKQSQRLKNQKNRPPSAKRISTELKQKNQFKKVQEIFKILGNKKDRQSSFQIKSKANIKQQTGMKQKQKPDDNFGISQNNQAQQSHEQFNSSLSEQSRKQVNKQIIQIHQNRQRIIQNIDKNQQMQKKQMITIQKDLQKKEKLKQPVKLIQSKKQIKNVTAQNIKKDINETRNKSQVQISSKQQKIQRQLFDNIPSGFAVETVQRKKLEEIKKPIQSKQQNYENFNIKQHNIQKVLTTKYLQSQNNNVNKPGTLAPPPKLTNNVLHPKQNAPKKSYDLSDVNQDQLQVLQWNGKAKIQDRSIQQNKIQDKPKKQQIRNKQKQPKQQVQQKLQQKIPQQDNQSKMDQQQNQNQQDSLDQILDELVYYTQRMEDIGQYRVNSKDLYNDKSIDKQLVKNYRICSYYMAHQFLYLTQILLQLIEGQQINRDYYTITVEQLKQLQNEDLLATEIENLDRNVQESKKLLKKCYEQCKPYLQKSEQILCLDGHTNYYKKCCSMLVKQFKKMLELLSNKPDSVLIQKRCCYLIEMFCVLKMFNSQNLKEFEELDEISDYKKHIQTYKHLLVGN